MGNSTPKEKTTGNVTEDFRKLWEGQQNSFLKDSDSLKQYQFLFITGFLSGIVKKFGGEYFDAQMSWLEDEQNGVPFTRVDKDTSENEYAKLKEQFPDSATDERIRRDNNFHDEGWDSEN